ncbi:hypothetical protein [Streptomyces sp. NBC_00076]|uniref:hypothetical protein n=1 Tax=Streptomyces sp. NBC_00076 TaxID=2975642 RepID=UPI00324B4D1E
MSRIYAHKVETTEESGGQDQTIIPPVHEGNRVFNRRDGEELSAAAAIIRLLDDLDNGEALVIVRDLW